MCSAWFSIQACFSQSRSKESNQLFAWFFQEQKLCFVRYVRRSRPGLSQSLLSDQRVLEAITSNVLPSLLVSHTSELHLSFSRRVFGQGAISEDGGRVVEKRGAREGEQAKRTSTKWVHQNNMGVVPVKRTINYALDFMLRKHTLLETWLNNANSCCEMLKGTQK